LDLKRLKNVFKVFGFIFILKRLKEKERGRKEEYTDLKKDLKKDMSANTEADPNCISCPQKSDKIL